MTHATQSSHDHGPAQRRLQDLREPTRQLRRLVPEVYDGFLKMSRSALVEGALSTKHKELIALALGVSEHCEGCIVYHARGAARAGATEQEVAEALGVAVLLGGGPAASDYAPRALQAFTEFAGDGRAQ
jgi:AhpD family alkylhydroperoxidase